eukprot:g14704.t1
MLLPWARLSVHAALNDDEFVLVDAPGVEERRSSPSKNPVAAAPGAPQVAGELEDHYGNGLDNENTARDATAAGGAAFSSPVDPRGTTTSSDKDGDEEDDLSQWGLVCESSFTNVISAAKEQAEADVQRLAAQSAQREASRKIAQKIAKDNLAAVYGRLSGAGQAMPKIPGDVLEEAGADGRVKDDDVVMLPSDEQEVSGEGDRIDASPSSKKKERAGDDVAPAPSMFWKLPSYPFSLAGFYNEPTVDVAESTVVANPVKEPEGEPGAVREEDQEFGYQKMDSSPRSAADDYEEEFEMVANDEDAVLQDEDVPIMHTGPPAEASDDGFSSSGSSAATGVAARFLSTYTASETPGPAYINIDEGSLLETHIRRQAQSGTTALVRSRGRGRPLLGNDYSAPKKLRVNMNQAYKVQEDPVSEALFLLASSSSSSSGTNFLPRGTELRSSSAAYSCAAAGMRFLGQSLHVRSPWSVSRYGSERASTVKSLFDPALYPTRFEGGPLSRSTLSYWNKSSRGDEKMIKNPFATFSGSATAAHAKLTYATLLRELRTFEEVLVRSLIADLEERIDADDAQIYLRKRQRLGLRNRLQYELLKLAERARAQNKRLVGQSVEDDEGESEDEDVESSASTASHGKPPGVFNTWASEYKKNLLTQSADKARKASTAATARRSGWGGTTKPDHDPHSLFFVPLIRYASPWTYYFPDVLAARGGRYKYIEQGAGGGLRRRRSKSNKIGEKFSGDHHLLLDDGDDFYGLREGGFYGSYDFGGEDFYSSKAYGPYDHEFRIHDFPAHHHQHHEHAPPAPDARPETPEADADMDIPAPEVDAPAPQLSSPDSPEVLDFWEMQEEQEPATSASPTPSQPYWRTPEGAEAHELIYNAYLKSHAKQAQAHDPKGGKTSLSSGAAPYHPAAEFAGSYGGEHDFHGQHYGSSWTAENEAAYAAMLQHRASLHHGEIAANVGGSGDGRWSKENKIQDSRRYKGHSPEEPNDTEEQQRARGRELADDIRKAMQRKRETMTKHEEVKAQRRAQRYFKSMMGGKDPEAYLADTTGSAGSTSSPSPPSPLAAGNSDYTTATTSTPAFPKMGAAASSASSAGTATTSTPPENTSTAEARPFGEETFRPIMKTTTTTKDSEHQTSGSEEVDAFFDGSTLTEQQEKVNKEHWNDLLFNWDMYSNMSASHRSSAGAVKKKADTTSSSTDTQNDGVDEIDAALKTVSLKGMKGTSSGSKGVGGKKYKTVPKGKAEASFLKGGAVAAAGSKWKTMVLPGAEPEVSSWEAVAPGKGNKNSSGTRRPKWEPRIDKATGETIWECPGEVGTTARYTWEAKTDEAAEKTYWKRQGEVAPATSSGYALGSKADKATGRTNWKRQGDVISRPASYTWEAKTDTATAKSTLEEDGTSKLTFFSGRIRAAQALLRAETSLDLEWITWGEEDHSGSTTYDYE